MSNILTDLPGVGLGLVIAAAIAVVAINVFMLFTRYNDMDEIAAKNEAAGYHLQSKLLGLTLIVAPNVYSSHDWFEMIVWSAVGIIVLGIIYLVVDFATPKFKVCEEIKNGNMSVAHFVRGIIVFLSTVMGLILM